MSNKELRDRNESGEDAKFVQSSVAPTEEHYLQSLAHVTAEAETLRIISFFLNGDEYAFEVGDAVEVLKPRSITEVPRVPDCILGLLSVRGEMISIMNIKKRLNIGSNGTNKLLSRILVVGSEDEEERTGFLVDGMGGVKELNANSIEQTDALGGLLKGLFTAKTGSTIRLLDLKKLLNIDMAV